MFYKPKYCCNCGEKIERAIASFTDSGRFCDVCKHDFVAARAAPKVFAALMAIFGLFGIGSYWSSGEKPLNVSSRQFAANPSDAGRNPLNKAAPAVMSDSNAPAAQTGNSRTNAPPQPGLISKMPARQTDAAPVSVDAAVYFCGAETKKGTPCSRRVKGGGRCWQHKGQTAMLPAEKLPASQ